MECCLATWFEPIRPLCVSMLVVLCILVCVAFDGLADGMPSFGSNSSINALKRARPNGSAVAVHDQAGTIQKVKKKAPKPVILTYSDEENIVRRVSVSWGDFINAAPAAPRTKPYIKSSALKALQQCTAPNASPTCKEALSDDFITTWKSRKVNGLCEDNAASKIHCYDSVGKTRMCVFENAMMDFQKVRKRKVDGHTTRSWEKGFLSADCGDMAPEDINYLALYKPDIVGREEAVCDFVFHEPVLAYSHENIRNFGLVSSDYLNVWTMMAVAGISHISKDVSFLNIDGIRRGRYFGDMPNQYFRTYNVTFRRILRAADFAEAKAKVCFKRLILPPKPTLAFNADVVAAAGGAGAALTNGALMGSAASQQCAGWDADMTHSHIAGISSLFQRWNLQARQNYDLLRLESLPTHDTVQILLIARVPLTYGPNTTHVLSRMFTNTNQIVSALNACISELNHHYPTRLAKLVVHDFLSMGFTEQVRLMASSSVVVGMHGAGIASTMHMAVGTKHCCGVVEIFPEAEFRGAKGYRNMARRMGHQYQRLGVAPEHTSLQGTMVPPEAVVQAVREVLDRITATGGSCFLPEVISTPYL